MATKPRKIQHRRSKGLKSKRQQRTRRKNNLFLKSFEFCKISVFNSDSQWNPSQEELAVYYPKPQRIEWEDLAARYIDRTQSKSPGDKAVAYDPEEANRHETAPSDA